jgi:hypothetical protein
VPGRNALLMGGIHSYSLHWMTYPMADTRLRHRLRHREITFATGKRCSSSVLQQPL